MVFFDEETEKICNELGYDLILPSAALREHLDSKIVTTRLGNEAGAPSVPNILTSVDSWDELVEQTTAAGSGHRRGAADAVRGQRQDDVLPHLRRPTGTSTPTTSSASSRRS